MLNTFSVDIETRASSPDATSLLIIYTGGTFGMVYNDARDQYEPFEFNNILKHVPELYQFNYRLKVVSFEMPIDSTDMTPAHWVKLAEIVEENYEFFDGFVVLHGTDTMAYSASALSFLLENLSKPVIFTGAQIPIGEVRNDARDNLISALEIAAQSNEGGTSAINEVCIYFDSVLLRGNRSKKVESSHFDAFKSENYPILAETGVNIEFNTAALLAPPNDPFRARKKMCEEVVILKLFPGISEAYVRGISQLPGLRGLIIESYGSGNAPSSPWFKQVLLELKERNVVVVNVSQCDEGTIQQGRYESSMVFLHTDVIGGRDITLEAAITKLMYLLGNYDIETTRSHLARNIRGELTE